MLKNYLVERKVFPVVVSSPKLKAYFFFSVKKAVKMFLLAAQLFVLNTGAFCSGTGELFEAKMPTIIWYQR